MKSGFHSLGAGILFGIGLGISQMTNPNKVINFIDIFGNWDPSLAFVMAGAVIVFFLGYKFLLPKWNKPIAMENFDIPKRTDIDKSLIIGSIIFGIGWALSGFCPAPGISSIVTLTNESLYFAFSMIVGVMLYHIILKRKKFEDG